MNTTVFSQVSIDFSDFEVGGWGLMWDSTGDDSSISNNTSLNASAGKIELINNSTSSITETKTINLTYFTDVTITFDYRANTRFKVGGFFEVEFSEDGGLTWTTIKSYVSGTDFTKGVAYEDVSVTLIDGDFGLSFTSTSKFRFSSSPRSSTETSRLFIDNVEIIGTAPGGIPYTSFELWLKADSGVKNGLIDALDGQIVDVWEDQETAKASTNATKVGTTNNATYVSNGINFNPAVNFKNDGYFDLDLDNINYTDFNIIAVVKRTSDKTDNFLLGTTSTTNYEGLVFGYSKNNEVRLSVTNSTSKGAVAAYDTPESSVSLLRGQTIFGGTKTIYELRDALSVEYILNKNNALQGYSPGVLGRGNETQGFEGDVSEVITYSATLDATELQKIYSYLAIKYGMTLDNTVDATSGDYLDSDGGIIWDASDNSAYHYNVTGIGKDDANELNQKQSTSQNAGAVDITVGLNEITDTNANNSGSCDDKEFLIWGNNDGDYTTTPIALATVDLSSGITPILATDIEFSQINRVWKFVETGSIGSTQISVPAALFSGITPSAIGGIYYMVVSNDEIFDETDEFIELTNYKADFDFSGTQYVTFGYAPHITKERSIYFDGTNYIDMGDVLELNPNEFTFSAWVNVDEGNLNKVRCIVSKRNYEGAGGYSDGYDIRINESGQFRVAVKVAGTENLVKTGVVITEEEWHHVAAIYNSGTLSLYIDGVLGASGAIQAPQDTDFSFLIGAADSTNPRSFFRGSIDEIRIWDKGLSVDQLRYVMNQEIDEHSDNTVTGVVIPQNITNNEVASIDWDQLAGYYPMSTYAYPGVLIDDSGNDNNGFLKNLNTVDHQTAPLPYVSVGSADWDTNATWENGAAQALPGSVSIVDATKTVDWNIVQIDHNVSLDNSDITKIPADNNGNRTVLGLFVNGSGKLQVDGATDISTGTGTGYGITVSHYLKLDGTIDLEGESQLIQTLGSDLEASSSGVLERDQQGTANLYSYNYWGSPVGKTKESSNAAINDYSFSLSDVLYSDSTTKVSYLGGYNYNGSVVGSTVSIADYWIWKFANKTAGVYALWQHMRSTGTIYAGEGFTMKGTGEGDVKTFQEYLFRGLPNNGTISLTVSGGNEYLVANPYPSSIDAYKFIKDNDPSVKVGGALSTGTLYFWEQYRGTSHILAEYEGGYATFTLAGGLASAAPSVGDLPDDLSTLKTPGQFIPVSQGFFTKSDSGGTIEFNNSQREFVKESEKDSFDKQVSIFMKPENTKSGATYVDNRDARTKFRLGFEAPQIGHRQILLTIDQNATDDVDWGYEGEMNGLVDDDMFWDLNNKKYVIQAIPDANIDREVPLGIIMGKTGIATIQIDALENVDESVEVYIKDALMGKTTQINSQPFEIALDAGTYTDRFALVFAPQNTLGVEEDILKQGLFVFTNNVANELQIKNTIQVEITSIKLFNTLGQLQQVWSSNLEASSFALHLNNKATGMYLVQINSSMGVVTKKIVIE